MWGLNLDDDLDDGMNASHKFETADYESQIRHECDVCGVKSTMEDLCSV